MTPRLHEFPILGPHGFSRLAYVEWGPIEASRVVVCVHGLTRNSRDFDTLAESLAMRGFRVATPDMPGRGRSGWVAPEDYGYPFYMSACAALIARLGVDAVDWVGTSMGGLIGMMLAAQPQTPVRQLVINDVGPLIPKAALKRIGTYVGGEDRFESFEAVEAHLRRIHAPFGTLTDAQWRHLATHSAVPAEQGRLKLHYDPAIAVPFTQREPEDVDLWPVWEKVGGSILVLRGAESDLLPSDVATEMTRRGRAAASGRTRMIEIKGCGHAPALMDSEQIDAVIAFLTEGGA